MSAKKAGTGILTAAPFWVSLGLIPILAFAAIQGGWSVLLVPLATWYLFTALDFALGLDVSNRDPETPHSQIFWHRLITLVWPPLQFVTLFALIAYATRAQHLGGLELIVLFFGMGILSGTVGIVYAHELMHQRSKIERWLGDILMAMTLYGHYRTEHLRVHHTYVGTPRDGVTARYNENFHSFFFRVVPGGLVSAFRAEEAMLARKGLPWWDRSNPFWRYFALQTGFALLALILGGWLGLGLFIYQAIVAIWQLELVNYIEHYGMVRKHLGGGKYEPTRPHHSWNATHRASNWLLI
ncbi:MAG: alkane 1-monooxygenase, partial [Alphaproteobacteria bacterium]|nr:alkane 1-monooxygenase [Alphaproteobacteria bacterium]